MKKKTEKKKIKKKKKKKKIKKKKRKKKKKEKTYLPTYPICFWSVSGNIAILKASLANIFHKDLRTLFIMSDSPEFSRYKNPQKKFIPYINRLGKILIYRIPINIKSFYEFINIEKKSINL